LRWIKPFIITISFLLFSCEIVEPDLNNPLDTDNNSPPSLVFYPDRVETTVGGSAAINFYILEVTGVAGIHAQIQYDNTKLSVSSVSSGSFFSDAQPPIFVYEDNAGVLDIFTFFMGNAKTKDGTGDIALVVFNTKLPGEAQMQFTAESELLDLQDAMIAINSLGQGVVNAQ
jgi:hypothetical protein